METKVLAVKRRKTRTCTLIFDSASRQSFIRGDLAAELGRVIPLPRPTRFRGVGNGGVDSGQLVQLEMRLAGVWVEHLVYVAPARAMDVKILIGHEAMQKFGIVLDMRRERVLIDPKRLKRANYIY